MSTHAATLKEQAEENRGLRDQVDKLQAEEREESKEETDEESENEGETEDDEEEEKPDNETPHQPHRTYASAAGAPESIIIYPFQLQPLIRVIPDEYKGIIGNYSTSTESWDALNHTLDPKNDLYLIHPVSAVFNMIKVPSTTWKKNIPQCESRYTTITFKLSTISATDKAWQQGLK